jgi:hypothetical protein
MYVIKRSCPVECLAPVLNRLTFASLVEGMKGSSGGATVGEVIELYEQGRLMAIHNISSGRARNQEPPLGVSDYPAILESVVIEKVFAGLRLGDPRAHALFPEGAALSALLGSLVVAELWQAITERSSIPKSQPGNEPLSSIRYGSTLSLTPDPKSGKQLTHRRLDGHDGGQHDRRRGVPAAMPVAWPNQTTSLASDGGSVPPGATTTALVRAAIRLAPGRGVWLRCVSR